MHDLSSLIQEVATLRAQVAKLEQQVAGVRIAVQMMEAQPEEESIPTGLRDRISEEAAYAKGGGRQDGDKHPV